MERAVIEETLKLYFSAFAEHEHSARLALLAQCLTEEAEIWLGSTEGLQRLRAHLRED